MECWTMVLSIFAGIFAVYYCFFSKFTNVFEQHGIPHLKPRSFLKSITEILVFPKPLPDLLQQMYKVHPDAKYIGIYDFRKPVVVIRDLELIKSIGVKNFDAFTDHIFFGKGNRDPLFSNNLIALCGDRWREVRSLLSPAFTSSKMKTMFQLMSECAVNFAEYLRCVPAEKRVMEMKDIFTKYANDVIATCAFGISVDTMRHPDNDFYKSGKTAAKFGAIAIIKIIIYQHLPALARLLNITIVSDRVRMFLTDVIGSTIRTRDEKNITRPDILQLMMDSRGKSLTKHGKELTIPDMTSQAFLFFLAGFETSSTLMSFAAHEIAINPNIQERLRNDIDKVLEETNGEPSYEAINEMAYLNAVIREALRKYPPQILTDRLCTRDFELPATLPGAKPYVVKKDTIVWIPFYSLQHDPNYFPEPDKFKPERFLDGENKDQYNPDAYHPFGLGPRMCIGNRFALLETKVMLFHLLARCELKPCERTARSLRFKKRVFLTQVEDGFWLSIVPRESQHPTLRAKAS